MQDQQAFADAHVDLFNEIHKAFLLGAQTMVRTPGFGNSHETLAYVIRDHLAAPTGDDDLNEMISILKLTSLFHPTPLGERARTLLNKIANKHAEVHAADLVDLLANT
jgi:hypothetical protein